MAPAKTIALFPEASYGAALNCVGIAQELRRMGHRPVFICHPGFSGVFAEYGFAEYQLTEADAAPTDWTDFIERHQDAFRQTPLDQRNRQPVADSDGDADPAKPTPETQIFHDRESQVRSYCTEWPAVFDTARGCYQYSEDGTQITVAARPIQPMKMSVAMPLMASHSRAHQNVRSSQSK